VPQIGGGSGLRKSGRSNGTDTHPPRVQRERARPERRGELSAWPACADSHLCSGRRINYSDEESGPEVPAHTPSPAPAPPAASDRLRPPPCGSAAVNAACDTSCDTGRRTGQPEPSPPPPPSLPPASPTGVCGYGTVLDAVTQKCEVSLGNGTEVLDGKCEVVLGSATEVLDGKVEVVLGSATEVLDGKVEVVLGSATEVLDGKVEVVLGSATEVIDGKVELIGLGDFDGDGVFRLADAVFVSEVWQGNEQWPVAGGRRARRSLESTSDDGVDLLALKDELERKDAELLKLRAELSKLLLKVKELEAEHRVVLD